jgi:hypothetical protein
MRHAYVGDVGDFGKYGLLRELIRGRRECRLAVVWYLTDSRESNNDGRHDSYLRGEPERCRAYRDCDPDLYDRLLIVREQRRLSVQLVESAQILPASTVFYQRVVPTGRKDGVGSVLWEARSNWLAAASDVVRSAELVFVDPDNGIIFCRGRDGREPYVRRPSHKHAYWHELESILRRGKSVVAYHHLGRQRGGHHAHITTCMNHVRALGYEVAGIHYRRGSARVFFVIAAGDRHREWLFDGCRRFTKSWSAHCRLVIAPMADIS